MNYWRNQERRLDEVLNSSLFRQHLHKLGYQKGMKVTGEIWITNDGTHLFKDLAVKWPESPRTSNHSIRIYLSKGGPELDLSVKWPKFPQPDPMRHAKYTQAVAHALNTYQSV